jgi:TolA-binding protein
VQTVAAKDHLATARALYDAGRWAAAEYEFGRAPASDEAEVYAALCAARLERPDAGARLDALIERCPTYADLLRFRAGVLRYDTGDADGGRQMLTEVNPRRLPAGERDEYHFKLGHSLFSAGGYDGARSEFAKVSAESSYAPAAAYYAAYMDYAAGDYAAAKQGFSALADDPSYSAIVPYYLLQIEFIEGNYRYVAENAERLIPQTAMPRRAELAGMAAQSWFHLGEYDRALGSIESYERMGGAMSRMENYTAGFALYRQERFADAAGYLARATGADDAISQNASYHLADIYLHLDDKQRALQSFSIAAASGHDAAIAEDALFNYGKLLFETQGGLFNEAINVLTRYIATYPESPRAPEAREYLIAAYYNSHDYEAAYEAIVQHPDPDNNVRAALQKITYFRALECYAAGDTTEAARLLGVSSQYRYNAKYTALAAFWQGEILYGQGDAAAAIAKYEEYLRLSPESEVENTMARYNLGYASFNLGDWAASRRRFDEFLGRHSSRDSYRADALNRVGDIDHAQREYWRAIERYDEAAAVGTGERYYSAYQRAMMLGLVGRADRKIESLQAIISANEGDYVEQATYELGRYHISRDNYSDGARTLAGFIERYPNSTLMLPALSNMGLAYLNMGDREQSMRYYKMIVERAPYSREAQDAMAGIRGLYVDAGDVDGYFSYAREAGAPTDVGEAQRDSLTFAAAQMVYLSGDGAKAIPALEGYIGGDARGQYIPTALGYLSGLYFAAGRHAEAADTYLKLWNLTTDEAAVRRIVEGYVDSTIATGDPERITAAAERVAKQSGGSGDQALRKIRFAAAGVMRGRGETAAAAAIYRELADAEVRTAEGAESAYRVIQYMYDTGDMRGAEEAVFAFSQAGTPHGYWLGEAFLTLGDIYVRDGDTFQARATFQSIVDGYSPDNDGIIAAAKERIANLSNE